jgi:hypothetical protein
MLRIVRLTLRPNSLVTPDETTEYVSQGRLTTSEAGRILPRLEKEKIRFQIETYVAGRRNFRTPLRDSRVALFIHPEDVGAWSKIRNEYFPV